MPAASETTEHPSEPTPLLNVSLDDKYTLESGRIFLTGIQALVRVPLEQRRADERRGLNTASFFSGYQGSPLGTLDKEIMRNAKLAKAHHLYFQPGLNEELGATSVWGSQLAPQIEGAKYDGVVGFWYGKNPGLDRAADAIRHANFCGTPPTGGAVAIVGDDPSCKSSTLPSASEPMCASLMLPVLFPGNVQEVIDYGLHAVALSRASGLWAALKIVTNVADANGTAFVDPDRVQPQMPTVDYYGKPYVHVPNGTMLAPDSLASERTLVNVRLEIARRYARINGINAITHDAAEPWLGIIASGKAYYDLMQALKDLGLGPTQLRRAGVRIVHVGMPWPLERDLVREWADGLEEILVIEEKAPFVESQVKEALYGTLEPPRVVGKTDEDDLGLLPAENELDADLVARAVGKRLLKKRRIGSVTARLQELEEAGRTKFMPLPVLRTPFFCSGCPHNSSTPAEDGALVGAGIGCHTMILLNPEGRGNITGITQMGGEGAQWFGMAPFLEQDHFVQNLGDGTFHHSGSLAIRAAAAAGVNVTYKLFANGSVAMTGAQAIVGGMTVPELTRWFALEGVKQVIVTADEPERYRGVELDPIASVRHRRDMLDVQTELSKVQGVTVLIHDQMCAAEKRRLRKRGKMEDPALRVLINERVCEGCGDCGVKSACLSVLPVETEFGRKTQIHQPSCNKDYSCLEGDCPSFMTVIPGKKPKRDALTPPADLPLPKLVVDDRDFMVRMIGIGGTGVVTVAQVLAMAAHLEGIYAHGLDQTGLSQKGGPVVSDIRLSRDPIAGSNKASSAGVDLYLGFDLLGAASPKNLQTADPQRTVAIVSTAAVPTGRMVVDTEARFPELSRALEAINAQTGEHNVFLDAQALSERVFDDHMPANMVCVGAAFQRGALPVSLAGDGAGDPAQRRRGGEEPGRLRLGSRLRGGARCGGGAGGLRARRGRSRRGALRRGARHRRQRRRGGRLRARAAAGDPGARADRVPGPALRGALCALRSRGAGRRDRAGARRERRHRGGRAAAVQADGVQGRVRGGAAAPVRAAPRRRDVRPRHEVRLQAAPAGAARAGDEAEAVARPLVRADVPAALRDARAAQDAAGSVPLRRGAARRAQADRRVRADRPRRAGRADGREPRDRGRAVRPARRHPRLRGDQAGQRRAFPLPRGHAAGAPGRSRGGPRACRAACDGTFLSVLLQPEREALAAACRRLAAGGLTPGGSGNAGVRVGDRLVVSATGTRLERITAEQCSVVELDGTPVEGPAPTSELWLHIAVHARFDGVGAVVHTHAPTATAVSTVVDELPVIHYAMLEFGGAVRVAPYRTFGTPELASVVADALEGRSAALMANHGAVVHAPTLVAAVERMELLEWACDVYRRAVAMGEPRVLGEDALRDAAAAFSRQAALAEGGPASG